MSEQSHRIKQRLGLAKNSSAPRLSDFELILVLAIVRLEARAYGAEMAREIERRTGRRVALGAIYKTLERLEAKKYLDFEIGQPRAERGGRRRKHYQTTQAGERALRQTLSDLDAMRHGLKLDSKAPAEAPA